MAQKQMHNDPSANALRFKLLGASASELGLKQTEAFPRVYGIIMDWNVNGMISSTIALYDGKEPRRNNCHSIGVRAMLASC